MLDAFVDLAQLILRLILLIAFAAIARRQIQQGRWVNLVVLWLGASLFIGLVDHYRICSQGLTCDVGGPGATWYYLRTVAGTWAVLNGVTFLAVIALLAYRRRRLSPELFRRRREVAYASCAGIAAMLSAVFVFESM